MLDAAAQRLLDALIESWDRNNAVMLNLLRALPAHGLDAAAAAGSPTVAQQFSHIHHERLISVHEEAPEYAVGVPGEEWQAESDANRIAAMLEASHQVVRSAVVGRVQAGRDLDLNFGHPALMLQLLIWHEGYHHGQIKLALKVSGCPIDNDTAGPLTWDVWRARMT